MDRRDAAGKLKVGTCVKDRPKTSLLEYLSVLIAEPYAVESASAEVVYS